MGSNSLSGKFCGYNKGDSTPKEKPAPAEGLGGPYHVSSLPGHQAALHAGPAQEPAEGKGRGAARGKRAVAGFPGPRTC